MAQLPIEQGINRFKANEDRFDGLLNREGYTSSSGVQVEGLKTVIDLIKTYNNRGDWATGIAYKVKDVVRQNGTWYVAVSDHTSTSFASDAVNNWRVYQGITSVDLENQTTLIYSVADYAALRLFAGSRNKVYVNGPPGKEGFFDVTSDNTRPDDDGAFIKGIKNWIRSGSLFIEHQPSWYGGLGLALANCLEYTAFRLAPGVENFIGFHQMESGQPVKANYKRGIKLFGAGMATANATYNALEGGTIIKGTLFNLAPDFEVHNLSVDVGPDVVASVGKHLEGLVLGTVLGNPNTIPLIKGVKCQNVSVLLGTPDSANNTTKKHALLAENLSGAFIDNCKLYRGWHGFAYKSQGCSIGSIQVYGAVADSYIIKGDATSTAANTTIQSIYMSSLDGTPNTPRGGPGVWESGSVAAGGNGGVKNITVGSITGNFTQAMIYAQGGNAKISGVQIGFVGGSNIDALAVLGSNVDGFVIDRWRGETVASNGMYIGTGSTNVKLGSGEVYGSANNGYVLNGNVIYDLLQANNCALWGIVNETSVIDPAKISGGNNGSGQFSRLTGIGLTINWVGAAPSVLDFNNIFYGNKCVIRGSLKLIPGKTEVVLVVEPAWRPKSPRTYPITGFVGSVFKCGIAVLNTDGRLVISNFAEFVNGEVCLGNIEWYLNEP